MSPELGEGGSQHLQEAVSQPGSSHNNNSSHPQVPALHQALVLKAGLGAAIQLSLQPSELASIPILQSRKLGLCN